MVTVNTQREDGECQEVAASISSTHGSTQEVSSVLESGNNVPEHWVEDNGSESIVETWREVDVQREVLEEVGELVGRHLALVWL